VLAEEKRLDSCLEIFTNMIEIGKQREMLKMGANEIYLQHKDGKVTKEQLDTTLELWYNVDIQLEQKTVKLYEVAQSQKCFEEVDESSRTEKGDAP